MSNGDRSGPSLSWGQACVLIDLVQAASECLDGGAFGPEDVADELEEAHPGLREAYRSLDELTGGDGRMAGTDDVLVPASRFVAVGAETEVSEAASTLSARADWAMPEAPHPDCRPYAYLVGEADGWNLYWATPELVLDGERYREESVFDAASIPWPFGTVQLAGHRTQAGRWSVGRRWPVRASPHREDIMNPQLARILREIDRGRTVYVGSRQVVRGWTDEQVVVWADTRKPIDDGSKLGPVCTTETRRNQ